MTHFDTHALKSYVAAAAVAVWSTAMLFAATAVPTTSAVTSFVA